MDADQEVLCEGLIDGKGCFDQKAFKTGTCGRRRHAATSGSLFEKIENVGCRMDEDM